ncbi:hypothetical protein B0J12DRAFT_637229 [Macrophomina phaseolina]|nr:hypothetical protein B0J12DRAFT_637229 [Macrophomina phaseolina]
MLYAICFVSMSLAIAVMLVWIFQCRPFMSNFSFKPKVEWCLNIDAARYTWAGVSIVIDLLLVYTPVVIVRQVHLTRREVKVLHVVFCGNLLGTLATGASCYGIWMNRASEARRDLGWTEAVYIMCNSIEILFYVLGSSLVVFSHHFISKGAKTGQNKLHAGAGQVRELNLSIFDRIPTRHSEKNTPER